MPGSELTFNLLAGLSAGLVPSSGSSMARRYSVMGLVALAGPEVNAGSGAMRAAAAESRYRKRAFNWTSRERFPSTSTVRPDLGERRVAQRFPGFADTEEVTGLNPCRAHQYGADQREPWSVRCSGPASRGCVPHAERFPRLTFLFKHPLGADPPSRSFERHL